ncbi:MAG: hypothetical protein SFW66_07160 [Gammaproteobacteria bacterium]|nr:hypothetical protein [Gammaproteobacteria bacterium]
MISKKDSDQSKLCPFSLGVAFGIAEAIFMLLFAWGAWLFGYGADMIHQFSSVYRGFAPTFGGGLIGALWGFAVGFIFGFIVGIAYDYCHCCCMKYCASRGKRKRK